VKTTTADGAVAGAEDDAPDDEAGGAGEADDPAAKGKDGDEADGGRAGGTNGTLRGPGGRPDPSAPTRNRCARTPNVPFRRR